MLFGGLFTGITVHDRTHNRGESAKRTNPIKVGSNSNNPPHLHRSIDHRTRFYDHPGSPLHLRFRHENPPIHQGEEPQAF